MAQRVGIARGHIDHAAAVLHQNLAARHFIESVDGPEHGGLARPRQAHEDRDLALIDSEAGVCRPQHRTGLGQDVGPIGAGIDHLESRRDVLPEDDVDVLEIDSDAHFFTPTFTESARSRMMARMTRARPASMPSGMLRLASALLTGLPRLGAPISVANTTIDSDSMMHWVSPAMIEGSAAGSSTFQSSCRLVAPKLSPASIMGLGIEVMPR